MWYLLRPCWWFRIRAKTAAPAACFGTQELLVALAIDGTTAVQENRAAHAYTKPAVSLSLSSSATFEIREQKCITRLVDPTDSVARRSHTDAA